jgi:hypothetical protein
MRRTIFVFVLLLLSSAISYAQSQAASSQAADAQIVRYKATIDTVKYVYGAAAPVARLKPGNILEANSLDCFGNALQKTGDPFSLVKGDNLLNEPFFIEHE